MKINTLMTVATVALALMATGCKYDKAKNGGAGAGIDDGAKASDISGASDINGSVTDGSEMDAQSGSLTAATSNRFEDMYAECTDVEFEPVYFGFDSTVVPSGEMGKIDAVAQHLQAKPERVVVVEGHCDERGSNEYNLSLGQNRAQIVQNYLIQSGISADRIQPRSYGSEKPAAEGHDEGAWSKNRRGEFGIFDGSKRK